MGLGEYIQEQVGLIPTFVYVIALIVLITSTLVLFGCKRCTNKSTVLLSIFILEYLFMIFGTTVIFRNTLRNSLYNFTPFWSYQGKSYEEELMLPETIVNIAMFIPVGVLICALFRRWSWWRVLMSGAAISITIEVSQFIFKKGFSEFDDVFHNTLGCMIGYGIYKISSWRFGRLNSHGNECK